jgi:hypothetical protein
MRFRSKAASRMAGLLVASLAGVFLASLEGTARAQSVNMTWKGHNWRVTSGGMAGVCLGNPSNVSVDSNGYLHMRITNAGGTWTAAELFTTERLGFGTYQWQIDGSIDRLDQNVVVGLFSYGPTGPRTNEIDIEYAFWGNPNGTNGSWTDYPASGTTIGTMAYKFSLNGGTFSTSRFIWSTNSIANFLMSGFAPVGSTTGLINSWTYVPSNPTTNIPQLALPLGMNLWCFQAPPSNAQNVEIIVRDFQFVPEGSVPDGGAGTGGAGGNGGTMGTSGAAGSGGATGTSGAAGSGGVTGSGGAASSGGATGTGGVTGAGSVTGTGGATGTPGAGGNGTVAGGTPGGDNQGGGCGCEFVRKATAFQSALLWLAALLLMVGRHRRRRLV